MERKVINFAQQLTFDTQKRCYNDDKINEANQFNPKGQRTRQTIIQETDADVFIVNSIEFIVQ